MDVNDKSQGGIEGKEQMIAVIVSVVLVLAVFGTLILFFVLSS
jgi:hypothetical protein